MTIMNGKLYDELNLISVTCGNSPTCFHELRIKDQNRE